MTVPVRHDAALEEDAALRFSRDPQTKEFLLAGSGQQHIEVVVAKLQKRKIRVPDLAMAGGFSDETHVFKVLALGAPNFKAVCMGRAGGLDQDGAVFVGVALREAVVNALRHGRGAETLDRLLRGAPLELDVLANRLHVGGPHRRSALLDDAVDHPIQKVAVMRHRHDRR